MTGSIEPLFDSQLVAETLPTGAPVIPVISPRSSPYISRLSIDGFGLLADVEITGLRPGLNVIIGPNEAGKSTLFDFLSGVLFGFPRAKADEHYRLPVNGGRHGGRVEIIDGGGRSLVVERHGVPHRQIVVTGPDGTSSDESEIGRVLGGVTKEVFRAVFAVDLDELGRLDGLNSEQVREVLFSSTVLGQRRSAAQAARELEQLRDFLGRPKQGGRANQLVAELRAANRELEQARTESMRYAELQAESEAKLHEVNAVRSELQAKEEELQELEVLKRCWTEVAKRDAAYHDLSEVGPLDSREQATLARLAQVKDIEAALSGHRERLHHLEDQTGQRDRLVRSVEERVATLGRPALDLADDKTISLDTLSNDLKALESKLTAVRARSEAAVRALERETHELQQMSLDDLDELALPPFPALKQRLLALRDLREIHSEYASLTRDVERDAENERLRATAIPPTVRVPTGRLATALTWGVSLAILVLGASLFLSGKQLLGLAACVIAVAAGGIAALLWRQSRAAAAQATPMGHESALSAREIEPRETGGAAERRLGNGEKEPPTSVEIATGLVRQRSIDLSILRRRLDEQGEACGIEQPITALSIESALREAEAQSESRAGLDARLKERAEAESRVSRAEQEARLARDEVEATCAEIEDLSHRSGLACLASPTLGVPTGAESYAWAHEPTTLLNIVSQLSDLREKGDAIRRIDRAAKSELTEVHRFETEVMELAQILGLEGDTSPNSASFIEESTISCKVRDLAGVCARALDHSERIADLQATISSVDQELDRVLGKGARAEALREDLLSGRVLEWDERTTAAKHRKAELEATYDASVREHERQQSQLAQLADSDAIVTREARCSEIESELEAVLGEYLVVSGARLLVQRTLRRYETERQPAVLGRAGEHFERITSGRYRRILIDAGSETAPVTVQVVDERGHHIDAASLSRGTVEQLYLCLRLALAESFAERYVPLPLVLDDVLVNFDPKRAAAVAREIACTALSHQVIALTCHPYIVEVMSSASSECHIIELPA